MPRADRENASLDWLLSESRRLRLAGQDKLAFEKLTALLAQSPGHVAANLAMADLLKSSGAREDALAALRRAAEHAPGNPDVWSQYVFELRIAGRKARARKASQSARVGAAQRKFLREIAEGRSAPVGDIARQINQGLFSLAWANGSDRLKGFPRDYRLLNLLGVAALSDGNPVRAETMFRRALSVEPLFESASTNLGLALLRQRRASEAVEILEPAAETGGASADLRINLASGYLESGQLEKADTLTGELLREAPEDLELLGVRGKTLIALGRASEAIALLRPFEAAGDFPLSDVMAEAIAEASGRERALDYLDRSTHANRECAMRVASLLAEWGELDRAVAVARRLAESNQSDPEPFRLLGLFSKWDAADPLIGIMRKGAESDRIGASKRGTFRLALAKAYMDTGENEKAMRALHSGNATLRSLFSYDVESDEEHMKEIARRWSILAIAEASTGLEEPAPIFIVGLPRSGSTLIETILSRHPEVEVLGESPLAFGMASKLRLGSEPAELLQLAEVLRSWLTPSPGNLVKTDKLLANFLNIGVLASCLPRARFIEMRRDYRATCFSIYQTELSAAAHPYSMNLNELARYAAAYDGLMDHWTEVLSDRLLRVSYRDLVVSPETEIPGLLSQLDLEWDSECLHPENSERRINTMSVGQVREPISDTSLEKWRRFEADLLPLTEVLESSGLDAVP